MIEFKIQDQWIGRVKRLGSRVLMEGQQVGPDPLAANVLLQHILREGKGGPGPRSKVDVQVPVVIAGHGL